MHLESTRQEHKWRWRAREPLILFIAPNNRSACKLGAWIFLFSCFRKAAKASQMQLPHSLEASCWFLALMCKWIEMSTPGREVKSSQETGRLS